MEIYNYFNVFDIMCKKCCEIINVIFALVGVRRFNEARSLFKDCKTDKSASKVHILDKYICDVI